MYNLIDGRLRDLYTNVMSYHAIAYYRVSTQQQGQSGLGLEAQRACVESLAEREGFEVMTEFVEVETGTRKRTRPELNAAIQKARESDAILLIAKIDRLARNVHFLSGLMESGIEFIACDMPQADKFTIHIMVALAEREAELISQRTRDALAVAKERGVKLGNPENLTNEARAKGAQVNQNKAQTFYNQVAPYIHLLRRDGLSYRKIASRLNAEGHRTRRNKLWSVAQVQNVVNKY